MLIWTLVSLDECQLWPVARTEHNLPTDNGSCSRAVKPGKPNFRLSLKLVHPGRAGGNCLPMSFWPCMGELYLFGSVQKAGFPWPSYQF